MAFEKQIQEKIEDYVYGHLPDDEWYNKNFYPFIKDNELRDRLIIEFKNARIIYKIFEGLQAKENLLLAQVKTQVIMYVSIQEAVINYVLFNMYKDSEYVKELMYQDRLIKVDIPQNSRSKLQKELSHMGKEILTYYLEEKAVDITKIRYDQKVEAIYNLNLISENLKDDLISLYTYRNTVHLEAEIKKGLKYDLQMSELAYRRVEGLSMELMKSIQKEESLEENKDKFLYKHESDIDKNQLVKLFKSVGWKTAEYPNRLYKAIKNSEYVMTVWDGENLVGLISAITDGYINVFITYLLVNPEYQKMGLGKIMMNDFMKKFEGFGRRILTTELDKEEYYKKFGFNIDGIAMFSKDWKEDLEG